MNKYIKEAVRQYRMAVDLSDPICLKLAAKQFMNELRELRLSVTYPQAKQLLTSN